MRLPYQSGRKPINWKKKENLRKMGRNLRFNTLKCSMLIHIQEEQNMKSRPQRGVYLHSWTYCMDHLFSLWADMYIFSTASERQCWWTWEWLSWLFRNHQCILQSIWCDSGRNVYRWRGVFNFGSGYIHSCPSVSCSRRTEATLTLSATFGRQIITLITAEVLYLSSLERHFSLTVNFLCHSSHNSSACAVNKDRKVVWGQGGHLSHSDSKDNHL